jgi:hypothetical protein
MILLLIVEVRFALRFVGGVHKRVTSSIERAWALLETLSVAAL